MAMRRVGCLVAGMALAVVVASAGALRAESTDGEPGQSDPAWQAGAGGAAAAGRKGGVPVVTGGSETLPRTHNQLWQVYDISRYTRRAGQSGRPEQAIVDWILRETGTELWFSEPLGILSASRDSLSVYHSPEIHELVVDVLERFLDVDNESHVFELRLVTLGSPNWRSSFVPLLRPVHVQSAGVDAWLLSKENAAMLYSELRKRADFRDQGAPNLAVVNAESRTVASRRSRNYVRSVFMRPGTWPGYEPEMGQVEEGFTLTVSPLLAVDQQTVDAVIKADIDQVERFVNVPIDVPTPTGGVQRVQIQVPQIVSWRLHERFRWPTDQVLLLSCGVVATPGTQPSAGLGGLTNPFGGNNGRADALLFIEAKGRSNQAVSDPTRAATRPNPGSRY